MVQLTTAQLAQAKKNLARNQGKGNLYRKPPAQSRGERVRGKVKQTARNVGNRARTAAPQAGKRATRATGRYAGRAVKSGARKVGGGVATFLTLLIGTGIVIAVIRRPEIVTAPLRFVTGITTAAVNVGKAPAKTTARGIVIPKGAVSI